jgi:RNA polymerase sigma factor (sigma-70 family)
MSTARSNSVIIFSLAHFSLSVIFTTFSVDMYAPQPFPSSPSPDLDRLRANDSDAWKVANPLLWQAVMAVGRNRLDGGDLENIASDVICNEVIPGLLGHKGESFDNLSSFADLLSLARRIMSCRCIDEIRRQCRRKEDSYAEVPEQEWEPEQATAGGRTWAEWMTLVQQELDPPDPDLFYARFGEGLTTREIAERRGMPHGTVVSRFARALKRLRGIIDDEDPSDDDNKDLPS